MTDILYFTLQLLTILVKLFLCHFLPTINRLDRLLTKNISIETKNVDFFVGICLLWDILKNNIACSGINGFGLLHKRPILIFMSFKTIYMRARVCAYINL